MRKIIWGSLIILFLAMACGGDGESNNGTPSPDDSASIKDTPPPDATADPAAETVTAGGVVVTDEEVAFDTPDGRRIRGHFYSIPGPRQQVVIFAHELPTDQTAWSSFAQELAAQGIAALTFDFRGFGESGGQMDLANIDIDLETALRFVKSRDYPLIYIYGASMGGTATMIVAARQELTGIVLVSAPQSFRGLDATEVVAEISEAKLLIAARGDSAGTYAEAVESYMRLALEPKESVLFGGAAHGTQLFEGVTGAQFRETLLDFLRR